MKCTYVPQKQISTRHTRNQENDNPLEIKSKTINTELYCAKEYWFLKKKIWQEWGSKIHEDSSIGTEYQRAKNSAIVEQQTTYFLYLWNVRKFNQNKLAWMEVRTHAEICSLEIKSNDLTTRPSWWIRRQITYN